MGYEYVTSLHRFRDESTGRFVPQPTIEQYQHDLIEAGKGATDSLADLVSEEQITPEDYIAGLRDEMKSSMIQQIMLGRGGRESMTARDWGIVGGLLSKQYALHDGFLADLKAGALSRDQIAARGRLYMEAGGEAFERGKAASYGVYSLPAYPKDGSSECMNGCGCTWRFETLEGESNTNCYWELDATKENCETCLQRNASWYPLEVRGGVLQPFEDIRLEAKEHIHE